VPREKKDQSTRLEGLTEGEVTLEGLLRSGEQKASSFVPENNPEKNEWYSLDLEAMAKQSDSQPVVVEMILGMLNSSLVAYHGREMRVKKKRGSFSEHGLIVSSFP
jgi:cytochrome oxidase assembly protein ShyY1